MKVFTVGLDQKPPLKDGGASAEKLPEKDGGSPPPGYIAATNVAHIPLPMGPELPQPPIVVRKSRGYKGILMVMLAVFLMALFALTLSEIAYNRQRDENFFRLRWAELKHRLGYGDSPYDYYHRANAALGPDRLYSFNRNKELSEALQQEPTSSSTTAAPSTTPEPVVAIDTFPQRPRLFQQSSSSSEQPGDGPLGMIRDARLQFLKTILQKIKQHAEDMGFDGTMQVSVIEVEPQMEDGSSPFGSKSAGRPQHPLLPNFFPHFPMDQSPALKPNSPSFLDGFGEIHQPTFLQNNQVMEENRARQNGPFGGPFPHEDDNQQRNGNEFVDFGVPHWPRPNGNQFRPDFFGPQSNNWAQQQPQQGFPQPPHILPRPPSFDRWSGQNQPNNMVDSEDSSQQHPQQAPPPPPMIQIFPHPMLPPMMGQEHPSGENFGPDSSSSSSSSSNASPSQEVVGEIYGRKFGRMLQDIIANRIQGFQHLQQMSPLMAPPSVVQQQQQQPERPRPFEGLPPPMNGQGMNMPPPFMPQQQMAMPPQWWPPMPGQQQQQQILPQMPAEEQKGDKGGMPPPPPIIFFPMQGAQPQQPQGQPPQFPTFPNKEMNNMRKEGQPAPIQFPAFKNFIPPEDRIQIEPPQNFPNMPQPPMGERQPPRPNSEEPMMKSVVDNNMAGPRGWTHQLPKPSSDSSSNSEESHNNQAPPPPPPQHSSPEEMHQEMPQPEHPESMMSPPEEASSAPSSSPASKETSKETSADNNEDVWLTGPPRQSGTPPRRLPPPIVDSSVEPNTPVDFPAVKFPNDKPNNEQQQPPQAEPKAKASEVTGPQNDHQPVLSNPVFFQVDEPEQPGQQRPAAAA